MNRVREALAQLSSLPEIKTVRNAPLSRYTRFGIGGPADIFAETRDPAAFIEGLRIGGVNGLKTVVIGAGTNLIAADEGFRGLVFKLTNDRLRRAGACVYAEGGASLQALVDFTVGLELRGMETMTGIPGSVAAAIYGNAGAYGHSISERISSVRFFDGEEIRVIRNSDCEFRYRGSVFKQHKAWIVLSAELALNFGSAPALGETAKKILAIRNKKYPPSMKCAGSIFKNLLLAELPRAVTQRLPPSVIIEGKVPSAWFLEQVGAKGMRAGDIRVADYHANLIYNDGAGTARDLVCIIAELKRRVDQRWHLRLEEEVQFVGF